jgi:hypothetical protein
MKRAFLFCYALTVSSSAAAQRTSFVTTLGSDTLSFEQYTRSPSSVVGDWVTLYGGIMFHHYEIQLRPDGAVSRYTVTFHRVDGKVDGSIDLRFEGDSVTVLTDGGSAQRAAVNGALPVFANMIGPLDVVISRARAERRDSTALRVVSAFGPYAPRPMTVRFLGGDSAWMGNPLTPLRVRLDRDGHIVALSARATTTRTETRRVPSYDLLPMIAHFPNIPDSTPIAGVPAISPRDTVRATLGEGAVLIDYGRPGVRGRRVFANGVLGDTVWRTGANAATQFFTASDLIVGRDTLKAGKYSLWTRVSPGNTAYQLVFNRQTGQWGTEYHADRDALTVPLTLGALAAPVERFTIRLPSSDHGSELRLEWSTTVLSVPIRVK